VPLVVFIFLAAHALLCVDGCRSSQGNMHEQSSSRPSSQVRRARRLPLCLFVTTAAFVHANKVLTAQYFVWYLALLPLLLPRLTVRRRGLSNTCSGAGFMWLSTMANWLFFAYRLEFLGHDVWTALWVSSLAFFIASMSALAVIVRAHDECTDGSLRLS